MKIKKIDTVKGVSKRLNKEVVESLVIDFYYGDSSRVNGTAIHSLSTAITKLGSKDSRKALLEYYWDLSNVINDIKNEQAEVIERLTKSDNYKRNKR